MPRARKGAARHQAKVRWFKQAKGNRGSRRRCWRRIKETVIRAGVNATKHRRLMKRDYRRLWVIRINAASRARGLSYSRFMSGLQAANIALNRKMLSEMAIADPKGFDRVFELAKDALESRTRAAA